MGNLLLKLYYKSAKSLSSPSFTYPSHEELVHFADFMYEQFHEFDVTYTYLNQSHKTRVKFDVHEKKTTEYST